jgi:DNA-binding transcriptional regulator YhcF (GntR family)
MHGKGIFVSSSPNILTKKERTTMLENHVRHMIYEAIRVNITLEETMEMVKKFFKNEHVRKKEER